MKTSLKRILTAMGVLSLIICLPGCSKDPVDSFSPSEGENESLLAWASGRLEVEMISGAFPAHVGEYLDMELVITTAGTRPVIELPDFSSGGFILKEWIEEPTSAKEEEMVFRYRARFEPLKSGSLVILPMKILSGDTISDEVITEPMMVEIPALIVSEEENGPEGKIPAPKPPEPAPEARFPRGFPVWIFIVSGAAVLAFFLLYFLKKRKRSVPEPAPAQAALDETERLDPGDYQEFYTRAASIIRKYEEQKTPSGEIRASRPPGDIPGEILEYYEKAAYSGRLGENPDIPLRSPQEDKTRLMVFFSKQEDDG